MDLYNRFIALTQVAQSCRLKQELLCLLVHGAAEGLVLVGGDHLVHIDAVGGQDAAQLLHGLLGQGGLPAQDPGHLDAEQAVVGAAVDQRVTLVVGGQHPVRAGGRVCGGGETPRPQQRPNLTLHEFLKYICNDLGFFTFKEGDLQLGRHSRVLDFGRAGDGVDSSIIAEEKRELNQISIHFLVQLVHRCCIQTSFILYPMQICTQWIKYILFLLHSSSFVD